MEHIETIEYHDTITMVNIILKKKLTREDLETFITLENQTQENMENTANENKVENTTVNKSIRVIVEKLEGGYISDATGKRKIYRQTDDILEDIGFHDILDTIGNDEYHVSIDVMPKDQYNDTMDLMKLVALEGPQDNMTLEDAKANGIIEGADKFNPIPKIAEPDIHAPIKVTVANAYSMARLTSIDWAKMHEELPLLPSEVTKITGMNTTSLYSSLPKARSGKFTFSNTSTRIGFTILAQYYEKNLGIRTSTKEACELMKEQLLKSIREIELMSNGKSHVKSSDVAKKLIEMRKVLM
jgi:hypothetical protein